MPSKIIDLCESSDDEKVEIKFDQKKIVTKNRIYRMYSCEFYTWCYLANMAKSRMILEIFSEKKKEIKDNESWIKLISENNKISKRLFELAKIIRKISEFLGFEFYGKGKISTNGLTLQICEKIDEEIEKRGKNEYGKNKVYNKCIERFRFKNFALELFMIMMTIMKVLSFEFKVEFVSEKISYLDKNINFTKKKGQKIRMHSYIVSVK
ncbi:hypothetical protein RFI_21291 [Reticulomyxa filosa]|uniref:Uncharacterized protein n=1 Tax=Reticulomyxa filosa TaxID=46433 RepID=X6MSI4_RETFI|nr:hypothetical protein RFI_21291 [Reticulomyxa filosa]|eukprot:ETO16070.1 hypothetical protein RFI_21291 [Reticulomyxa filosa]